MITYGIKGACAYLDHAQILGAADPDVYGHVHELLDYLAGEPTDVGELTAKALDTGALNYRAMELLDEGNTHGYGHPEPTQVRITPRKGKAIVVSGHDLLDLDALRGAAPRHGRSRVACQSFHWTVRVLWRIRIVTADEPSDRRQSGSGRRRQCMFSWSLSISNTRKKTFWPLVHCGGTRLGPPVHFGRGRTPYLRTLTELPMTMTVLSASRAGASSGRGSGPSAASAAAVSAAISGPPNARRCGAVIECSLCSRDGRKQW
jgi:hypothetical protein